MDAVLHVVDPAHQHCYTLDELRTLLEAAAFSIQNPFRYRFDLVWGMMAVEAVGPALG
jgi:hypothetical protein